MPLAEQAISLADWARWYALDPKPIPAPGADHRPETLPAHIGLWLDRCLVEAKSGPADDNDHPGRRALYGAACEALDPAREPPALAHYRTLFVAWERQVRARHPRVIAQVREVQARSRLLLHPNANASVTDGGLLLHHTYGVPYLPGTALKGVCRAFAERLHLATGGAIPSVRGGTLPDGWVAQLFGSLPKAGEGEGTAGLFDFWDALWIPPRFGEPQAEGPLALDVVNPHHSDYYTKGYGARPPPRESDAPVPTHRLTVRRGARFLIRVEALDNPALVPWLGWVLDTLLLPALTWEGIGTRTTSGYGRLAGADLSTQPGAGGAMAAGRQVERCRDLAMVTRTRGDGALHATLPDGKVASLRGDKARALYRQMSDAVRARIDRNKPTRLQVTWTKEGKMLSIEAIDENP